MYDLDHYGIKIRPKPIPFWVPQYTPGYSDRNKADALLPFNEKYINNYGNRTVTTTIQSQSSNAQTGTIADYRTSLTPFDGGLRKVKRRRSNMFDPAQTLTENSLYVRFSLSALYDNMRVGHIETDPMPIYPGQTPTVYLVLTPNAAETTSQLVTLKGAFGSSPTTNADIDALTLTTASASLTWGTTANLKVFNISSIVQEIVADPSWEYGNTIKLVAVNTSYATYGNGSIDPTFSDEHYFYCSVTNPRIYMPVTPIGRMYNFGGYSPGEVPLADDIGDTIDGTNIFSNYSEFNGDYVGAAFNGINYIQYTPTEFTTNWYFYDVINSNYIPESLELVIEASNNDADNQIGYKSLVIKDTVGTIIASISSPQEVDEIQSDRNRFVFRVPLDHSSLDVTKLAYLKCELSDYHVTSRFNSGDVRIYGVWMRPVFGQRTTLKISNVPQFSTDFAVSFVYYSPVEGGNERLLQFEDVGDDQSLPFVEDSIQFNTDSFLTYDSNVQAQVPAGLNHCIIQYRDGNLEVYINGKLGLVDTSVTPPSDTGMVLGANNWAISDFRIYSKPLSQPEIDTISNDMFLYRKQCFTDPTTWTSPRDSIGCDPLILLLGLV